MTIPVNPKAKALIFDLDGTLADTMPAHRTAWVKAAKYFGAPMTEQMVIEWSGMASYKIVSQLNTQFNLALDPKEVSRKKAEYFFEQQGNAVEPIEPVYQIAKTYRDKLPMAVGTGSRRPNAERILRSMGILDWFGAIVSADDVDKHKPEPDTFLSCADQLKVDPAYCQVFEDADFGVQAAISAGMIVTDIRHYI